MVILFCVCGWGGGEWLVGRYCSVFRSFFNEFYKCINVKQSREIPGNSRKFFCMSLHKDQQTPPPPFLPSPHPLFPHKERPLFNDLPRSQTFFEVHFDGSAKMVFCYVWPFFESLFKKKKR